MAFASYLLFLAMSFIRPDAFAPELAKHRPIAVLIAIALPLALLAALKRKHWSARPAAFATLTLLVLTAGVSVAVNGWIGGGFHAIGTFLPSALAGVLTMLNITSWRRLRIAAAVIVWCMTGLTALSTYSFYTGYDAYRYVLQEYGSVTSSPEESFVPAQHLQDGVLFRIRSVGLLADPNDFSQLMVVALALLWGLHSRRGKLRDVPTLLVPSGILLWGLYLTHSRGALIGLGLAAMAGLWGTLGPTRSVVVLGMGGLLAKVLNFTGGREISDAGASASHRIDYWNLGLHLTASHPLFGVGFGNFENANTMTGQTAHNTFMLCAAELGLIGLFLFTSLLLFSFRSVSIVIAGSADNPPVRRFATGLRAALVGFLGCAWFLSRTYDPLLYMLLGLCLACAPAAGKAEPGKRPWVAATAIWALLILVLLYAFVVGQRIAGH
ncbi:MAG: O-antigen ligase family protein [Betaproteobacteria bacterium]|nr:O-antigen ligase family protein [Betaproteobacteria bacterium]